MLEWSGEVRNITYSADAKSVSVVYRVTLYGTDAEVLAPSIYLKFPLMHLVVFHIYAFCLSPHICIVLSEIFTSIC